MNLSLLLGNQAMGRSTEAEGALAAMGEEEFRQFYERTARPLWAYLSRITRDPARCDDYLQEAYYRFYRAGAKHESESHRRNSLFQIATNIVRDAGRRGKNYEEVSIEDEHSHSPMISGERVPEQQAAIRTDMSRALAHLEPLQRQLLWLAYGQGASHEEIAAIVGLRAVSIRTLLLRARRRLAAVLDGGKAVAPREDRP